MLWIGTSWKMNRTGVEAVAYARALRAAPDVAAPGLTGFIIPPFTALSDVCRELAGSPVLAGAQTMHWAAAGAFTGEVSAAMIAACGAAIVELGHSERRRLFAETDATVNLKVRAALAAGLRPLICVGETAEERGWGVAAESVARQVKIALHDCPIARPDDVLLAYEPVWAIGEGGVAADPDHVARLHAVIRAAVAAIGLPRLPILYGGSVNLDNCTSYLTLADVDGLFIGRAAWTAPGYLAIWRRAAAISALRTP